ncbi:uncharacterized protein LOC112053507 [Bicyclus anynana]|uniref:Uncharacterized protein LOC112053507 n=1 Tax=Bicyclus anynana TaxID=110368 RepID=A0A6J1NU78_BICAN|nr:uncharacterized protein LOC112053507 [Bicyclus anynana]XP_052747577.1 uncharacterized protein LOC112053507 [Bicyclus anynana]
MFWFMLLLAAGAAHAQGLILPDYVQSREAYTHIRLYISENLPPQHTNDYDPKASKYYSFSILAGVTAAQAVANRTAPDYDPLLVLDHNVPLAWRNYNKIAQSAQALLNEASAKISMIEEMIDLCGPVSPQQCNAEVQAKVIQNPFAYQQPADLLLLLGTFSKELRSSEPVVDIVTQERSEIPFLINNVHDPKYKTLVEDLDNAYRKMREVQFRRYNPGGNKVSILFG